MSAIHFLRWAVNILVSSGSDRELLDELEIFTIETQKAQFKPFLVFFILIGFGSISLVCCLF